MVLASRTMTLGSPVFGGVLVALALSHMACTTARKPEVAGAPEAPTQAAPLPPPQAPSLPPEAPPSGEDNDLVVAKVAEPIVVVAWAEPRSLPPGGGQAQLLVRVQKHGGVPYPGVEVRFKVTSGSLYSGGHVLATDKLGLTRDRITTKKTATVTVNAGGTVHTFQIPVGD